MMHDGSMIFMQWGLESRLNSKVNSNATGQSHGAQPVTDENTSIETVVHAEKGTALHI